MKREVRTKPVDVWRHLQVRVQLWTDALRCVGCGGVHGRPCIGSCSTSLTLTLTSTGRLLPGGGARAGGPALPRRRRRAGARREQRQCIRAGWRRRGQGEQQRADLGAGAGQVPDVGGVGEGQGDPDAADREGAGLRGAGGQELQAARLVHPDQEAAPDPGARGYVCAGMNGDGWCEWL